MRDTVAELDQKVITCIARIVVVDKQIMPLVLTLLQVMKQLRKVLANKPFAAALPQAVLPHLSIS